MKHRARDDGSRDVSAPCSLANGALRSQITADLDSQVQHEMAVVSIPQWLVLSSFGGLPLRAGGPTSQNPRGVWAGRAGGARSFLSRHRARDGLDLNQVGFQAYC